MASEIEPIDEPQREINDAWARRVLKERLSGKHDATTISYAEETLCYEAALTAALSRAEAAEARVGELETALEPFTPYVDLGYPDNKATVIEISGENHKMPGPSWGDFRRARAARKGV